MIKIIVLIIFGSIFSRDLEVEFLSEDPWIAGHPWASGIAFDNGITYGLGIYGNSSIGIDSVSDVHVYFSENPDSASYSRVFSSSSFGQQIGIGVFPGSAWDMSDPDNPRRLNLCFFERDDGNLLWDPTSVNGMDLEYLLIMDSDYDSTGSAYDGVDILYSDVQYFCWLKKRIGEDWFSSEPATLTLINKWSFSEFYLESNINSINVYFEHEAQYIEQQEINYYIVRKRLLGQDVWEEQQLNVGVNNYEWEGLSGNQIYEFQVSGYGFSDNELIASDILDIETRQVSYNTELIGFNNTANEVLVGASTYNDIWGYTSSNGKEYALIGTWDGTQIIDISTDPMNPITVGYIPGSYSTHRDIKTYDEYMYIGTEANRADPYLLEETGEYNVIPQGIQVVDLSDPENAELVYEWDGVVQSHNVMEYDGYLYVIGSSQEQSSNGEQSSWGLDDLIILDLNTDPSTPIKVGGWSGEYIHDVCLYEDRLYASMIYTDEVYVFDVSDKTSPQLITQWGGIPNSHACWVSDDGNILFTASETSSGHILSWDVSDIDNVNFLDEWFPEDGEDWSAHNIFYKNGYIIASYYAWGVQIVNVEDPSNMYTAGYYDTFNFSSPSLYDGAWGVFPYFESDKIIVSDRRTGLYVVDFTLENWSDPNIYGDVNNDNIADILDIMILVNYIVNGDILEEQYDLANINNDDVVDILDIILLINIILE